MANNRAPLIPIFIGSLSGSHDDSSIVPATLPKQVDAALLNRLFQEALKEKKRLVTY